jgi:hypothetical protein
MMGEPLWIAENRAWNIGQPLAMSLLQQSLLPFALRQ